MKNSFAFGNRLLTSNSEVIKKKTMKIPFSMTQDSLTIFYGGAKTFLAGTIQYNSLKAAILEERWNDIPALLTTGGALAAFLAGSFAMDGDQITHNGTVLPASIQNRIKAIADAGGDVGPMFRLYERLAKNPSFNSRTQLHRFLEHNDISVEADGTFLAYKGINEDMTDRHTGTIDNTPGTVHEMERNLVSDDLDVPCHFGFHVGALEYATGFAPVHIICRVDPEHVVAVPKDYNSQKMRVCKYEVVGFWSGEAMDPVADPKDLPYSYGDENAEGDFYDDAEDDDLFLDEDEELEEALDAGRRGRLQPCVVPDVVVFDGLENMNTSQLMECSLDLLRKYASNELLIHGASKIPGGKSSLVAKILKVRKKLKK